MEFPVNKDITYLGQTSFRNQDKLFGIKRKDRRQHVYVLGKSGTGKSVLLSNMIVQNINNGDGVCVVDPHGELVESVLQSIPPHRIKDVIYFNPADTDFHIGFNVLELLDPKYKHLVASGLMGIFTKIWANAWSARMEYILNNAILALLDTPGSTLLGIPRLLVDKDYRQKIINNLKDPVIKAFWIHEYEAWQDKFRNEAIAPIQNKVGQFLSTSIIRNVVGQSNSTINIFDTMNDSKIFLVNVSKGRIGEDNSALLGGMIITKVQLAAMERVRIPEDERKDFYLYVDEFQNFVTDSFASILSEARKYRLNLTVAHQYTAQLVTKESSSVRDAVFGNVGTMIVFRVGADDADFLEKEFEPEFTPQDIVNLPNYKVYLRLMIDGITSRPFSAKTLPPMARNPDPKVEEEVIRMSRELYCRSKEVVEREINNWSGMSLGNETDAGMVEKFAAECSICKKQTEVPFKPEPGRPVYCKDCIAKIKSGETQPIKGSMNQIKQDESRFFQPLADLGIEFPDKKPADRPAYTPVPASRPGIFNAIKKVFTPSVGNNTAKPNVTGVRPPLSASGVRPPMMQRPVRPTRPPLCENMGLKDALSKAFSIRKTTDEKPKEKEPELKEVLPPTPTPMSLKDLSTQKMHTVLPLKDRGASAEDMNKLKNLISQKVPEISPEPVESPKTIFHPKIEEKKEEIKVKEPEPVPPPVAKPEPVPTVSPAPASNTVKKVREVPEDILRSLLE